MKLFDAHCHLQDERLAPELDAILKRAYAAGVERMLCCGTAESDWPQVTALSRRHSALSPAFGIHPWYVSGRSQNWLGTLTELLLSEPAAIVGEIGLDHAIEKRNDDEQMEIFAAQLRLAKAFGRPACIHCRKAWESAVGILDDMDGLSSGFILHSYSGPVELVPVLAEMGAYFSFSGSITRHRNERSHTAAIAVPIDRILIETDSPDLTPVEALEPARSTPENAGKPNEPANLVHVLRKVAELRRVSEDEMATITYSNACRLLACGREQA